MLGDVGKGVWAVWVGVMVYVVMCRVVWVWFNGVIVGLLCGARVILVCLYGVVVGGAIWSGECEWCMWLCSLLGLGLC